MADSKEYLVVVNVVVERTYIVKAKSSKEAEELVKNKTYQYNGPAEEMDSGEEEVMSVEEN